MPGMDLELFNWKNVQLAVSLSLTLLKKRFYAEYHCISFDLPGSFSLLSP